MSSTLLVTGASGFVGRHLCRRLAASGHKVHAIVRSEDPRLARLGVKTWIADLWDADTLRESMHGVDAVIHCAGNPTFGDGDRYQRENVDLTKHVLAAAASGAGAPRFVLVSTIGAVDRAPGDDCRLPLNESSAPAPTSDYGRSKLAAEEAVRAAGLPFAIVRPAMVVGDDMRHGSHFAVFARHAISGSLLGRVAWTGSFSVVHAEDLAGALETVALHPQAAGKTFFCAGTSMALGEYFKACAPKRLRLPIDTVVALTRPLLRWAPFAGKVMLLPALTATDAELRRLGWRPRFDAAQALAGAMAREQARLAPESDPGGQSVITGAASGLGRAMAEQLAALRGNLLLVDRDREGLAAVAANHPHCRTLAADLATPEGQRTVLESEAWRSLPVRELFACAGFGARGKVHELSLAAQLEMFSVNLSSRLALAHDAARGMAREQFGRIVFVSSSSAFQPLPLMASYSASNAALLFLGEAWSTELAEHGVHLMTVCPGGMQTNFQKSAGVRTVEGERLMQPAEVARRILQGLARRKTTLIVSFRSFAMSALARVLPRQASLRLWYRLMGKLR